MFAIVQWLRKPILPTEASLDHFSPLHGHNETQASQYSASETLGSPTTIVSNTTEIIWWVIKIISPICQWSRKTALKISCGLN